MFTLKDLLENLALKPMEPLCFQGGSLALPLPRVFGGQVLAQSLRAAAATVDADRQTHSLHGYFLRPGDTDVAIDYRVEPIRDGGSFSTRQVVASQHQQAIFTATLSFQTRERGLEHQQAMPADIPSPEGLQNDSERTAQLDRKPRHLPMLSLLPQQLVDIRSRYPRDLLRPESMDPVAGYWFKFAKLSDSDPAVHQSLLAYMSDVGLLSTGMRPHFSDLKGKRIQAASLDHALWFHSDFRVDEWLYYHTDSPRAAQGRDFNRGSFYNHDGVLVASSCQEGLIRVRDR